MFIGVSKNADGTMAGGIYNCPESWFSKTFSPELEVVEVISMKLSGSKYWQKQAALEEFIHSWFRTYSEYDIGWSYGEIAIVDEFISKNARRYGLVQELRNNGFWF